MEPSYEQKIAEINRILAHFGSAPIGSDPVGSVTADTDEHTFIVIDKSSWPTADFGRYAKLESNP